MLFIAEIGVCHNGDVNTAMKMVDAAREAGADCAKFQLFDAARLGRPEIAHLQLSPAELLNIKWHCDDVGIEFLCTPFHVEAVEFLTPLVKRFKLASGAMFDRPLQEAAVKTGLPIIASTGMCGIEDLIEGLKPLNAVENLTLLHCVSSYPLEPENANLWAMATLRRVFQRPVGYSDHSANPDVILAAAACGAMVIEAHITLDRTQNGPDHTSSFEPAELKETIRRARLVEAMLGTGEKRVQPCEQPARGVWKRD